MQIVFFKGFTNLESVDFSKVCTSNTVNMSWMFQNCTSLKSVDLSNFDTSKVTDISGMFASCESLESVTFGENFNTSNITDLSHIFNGCKSLSTINNINVFDTSHVTSMNWMFNDCNSISSLDLSSFDTSNVTSMRCTFQNCNSLSSLILGNWNTSNVINMGYMFKGCSNLQSLPDISNFETSNVTNLSGIFHSCNKLTGVDLTSWNTSNVEDMSHLFDGCFSLSSVDIHNFDTSKVTDMQWMFNNCSNLSELDLSNFDTSNVVNMLCMFQDCTGLTTLDLSNFNTTNVTNMNYMFNNCNKLKSLNISSFDLSNVTDLNSMLYYCISLRQIFTPKTNSINSVSLDDPYLGHLFMNYSNLDDSITYNSFNSNLLSVSQELRRIVPYTVNHYKETSNGFDLVSTETLYEPYGVTVTPEVNTYEGYTSPSSQTITLDFDLYYNAYHNADGTRIEGEPEVQQIVNYYYRLPNSNKSGTTETSNSSDDDTSTEESIQNSISTPTPVINEILPENILNLVAVDENGNTISNVILTYNINGLVGALNSSTITTASIGVDSILTESNYQITPPQDYNIISSELLIVIGDKNTAYIVKVILDKKQEQTYQEPVTSPKTSDDNSVYFYTTFMSGLGALWSIRKLRR
jgi:surface protein